MKWLGDKLRGWLQIVIDTIAEKLRYLGTRTVAAMGGVVVFILTPINWALQWMTAMLHWLAGKIGELASVVAGLHFGDLATYWSAFSPYFALLDLFIPLGLLTSSIAGLFVLWVLTLIVRVIIRFLPSIAGVQVGGN